MSSENVEVPLNAETKFWGCQDLVEELLMLLDAHSTLNLATVHPLTVSILETGPFWRKLIKRTCRVNDTDIIGQNWAGMHLAAFEEQRIEVQHLVEITRLMGNPKP